MLTWLLGLGVHRGGRCAIGRWPLRLEPEGGLQREQPSIADPELRGVLRVHPVLVAVPRAPRKHRTKLKGVGAGDVLLLDERRAGARLGRAEVQVPANTTASNMWAPAGLMRRYGQLQV
jgi:hypothetical protein